MGKKSRLKKERRTYQPPPIIAKLLDDYFAAEEALEAGSGVVLFRGQLVTRETLFERLHDEVVKQEIDEEEMAVAWTHVWNAPPT